MYYSILRYWHGQSSGEKLPDRAGELIGQAYRDAVRSVDGFMNVLTEAVNAYDPVTVFHSDHGRPSENTETSATNRRSMRKTSVYRCSCTTSTWRST